MDVSGQLHALYPQERAWAGSQLNRRTGFYLLCSRMAKWYVCLLFCLLTGLHTNMAVDGMQVVSVPLDTELTQALINSERLHTDNVSASVEVTDGLEGFTISTDDDGSVSANLTVCGTINLNKIVDELLDGLRKDIIERGKDIIPIPDIHETFSKRVGFIKLKGEFKGEKGWVKSMSTIHRTADVIASSYGKWLSVSCGFGLGHLEVGYDRYKATFMRLGPHGKINAVIGQNSILLKANVTWANHKCTTTLNELVLNQFGGLKLKVTGLGPLNWLLSKISSWVLHHFKAEIKGRIESTLREEIEKKLSTFDCSKYFPKL